VSDVPDRPEAAAAAPLTRAQRRAAAPRTVRARVRRQPLVVVALSGLIALTGFSHPFLVALAVALAGLVVAWGWAPLLGLPSPRGTSAVLAVGVAACVGAAALTTDDPFLEWIPGALAVSLIGAFLHQLLRRDGRPRLTESVAGSGAGLAILSMGVAYIPLPRTLGGSETLAAAMAALALSALADLATASRRLRPWALPIAMVLGGAAATVVGLLDGRRASEPPNHRRAAHDGLGPLAAGQRRVLGAHVWRRGVRTRPHPRRLAPLSRRGPACRAP